MTFDGDSMNVLRHLQTVRPPADGPSSCRWSVLQTLCPADALFNVNALQVAGERSGDR